MLKNGSLYACDYRYIEFNNYQKIFVHNITEKNDVFWNNYNKKTDNK